MKTKDMRNTIVLVIVAMLVAGAGMFFALGGGSASTVGTDGVTVDEETGEVIGRWANQIVNYKVIVSDEFTGADVSATAKVYDEQPEDWGNPRGDFDEARLYTVYTASDGEVLINKETPGMYYVVMTASGYNTEFYTIEIPDGTNQGDLSDYQDSPEVVAEEMTLVGSTTDEDFDFTLANETNADISDTVLLDVDDNTEFRGWKVIVNDEQGFSLDTDGDGTYDEGVSKYVVAVGNKEFKIFEPDVGVDEFDSNDEFTFQLDDLTVADGSKLEVSVEIDADTGDYTGANDEVWGEGEGVLSYIKIYDDQGSLFATVDVSA